MNTFVRSFNFKSICFNKFEKNRIIRFQNFYTNVPSVTTTSSLAERILTEQRENIHKCKDDYSKFRLAHNIVKKVLSDESICIGSSIVSERNQEIIEYNVNGGRLQRMKIFLNVCENLTPKHKLTDEYILRSWILGHLTQVLLSSLLMIDDALDKSDLRRNKVTWYRTVGSMEFCSHSLMLNSGIQVILKNLFSKQSYYTQCIEIFNEILWIAESCFALEAKTIDVLGENKKYCSWKMFDTLSVGLMATTGFQLPVIAAMCMAGVKYDHLMEDLAKIFAPLGCLTTAENDYYDVFGKSTGKVLYEDIKHGKLTWVLLTSLDNCNSDQKKILQECYGKDNPECIDAVVQVYRQLNLEERFLKYKTDISRHVTNLIKNIADDRLHVPLLSTLYQAENWYRDV
ncbi:farnesyl pyrophosphate synthase-like [Planococcus citri]|uniref:farnesyl pyrophosphate synthase-like n=1 Tax=Planococcus citri TaxID=170843 RepID=UPI0031F8D89E